MEATADIASVRISTDPKERAALQTLLNELVARRESDAEGAHRIQKALECLEHELAQVNPSVAIHRAIEILKTGRFVE